MVDSDYQTHTLEITEQIMTNAQKDQADPPVKFGSLKTTEFEFAPETLSNRSNIRSQQAANEIKVSARN